MAHAIRVAADTPSHIEKAVWRASRCCVHALAVHGFIGIIRQSRYVKNRSIQEWNHANAQFRADGTARKNHAAKLAALRAAAQAGFDAIDRGRFRDVEEEDVAGYVASLGRRAGGGVAKPGA